MQMKCNNHIGPINRNLTSSRKDGFLPSILCPMNWPIHEIIKIIKQTNQTEGPPAFSNCSNDTIPQLIRNTRISIMYERTGDKR